MYMMYTWYPNQPYSNSHWKYCSTVIMVKCNVHDVNTSTCNMGNVYVYG